MIPRPPANAVVPPRRPLTVADLEPVRTAGPPVWVPWNGRWKRGTVIAVGSRRVRVRFTVGPRSEIKQRWFTVGAHRQPDKAIYDGRLTPPVTDRCPDCGRTLHGRPGQPVDEVRGDHVGDPWACRPEVG
ncbi:hypothetical protein ACN27G_06150 [Plantactinospora sp. WMMB334]|uniref:hypothetical protein n=1 Tax=Plantactinospora sp. WMMB334 TaxID=3404119 RepID=UPI003B93CCCE